MPPVPPRAAAPIPGKLKVAALVAGALVVLWLLNEGRGSLRGLLLLLGFAMVAFVVGRAGWRWWQGQPSAIARMGLLAAFGFAAAGWLTVALVQRLSRVSGENYIWILMWPVMLAMGLGAAAAGLMGACVGAAVAVSAPAEPGGRRALLIAGGATALFLNLSHIYGLVRLLLTG
jgi:hypothetical protein